jgi:hypothetical protein
MRDGPPGLYMNCWSGKGARRKAGLFGHVEQSGYRSGRQDTRPSRHAAINTGKENYLRATRQRMQPRTHPVAGQLGRLRGGWSGRGVGTRSGETSTGVAMFARESGGAPRVRHLLDATLDSFSGRRGASQWIFPPWLGGGDVEVGLPGGPGGWLQAEPEKSVGGALETALAEQKAG